MQVCITIPAIIHILYPSHPPVWGGNFIFNSTNLKCDLYLISQKLKMVMPNLFRHLINGQTLKQVQGDYITDLENMLG